MAQNTVVWLLSKGLNDIATSGETPKFDIKWSLPIYDHLTDGTVMTTPYANPGPDMDDGTTPPTHNQKDPGDFNGLFYTNGLKYSLSQWETDGTAGVTETTGWAKNPEWSLSVMERDTSRPAEANTGSNTTFLYGSVSGGTFSGDDYGTNHLSSWSVSNLYENVRYDGTSTEDTDPGEDPRAYAHYTVYLRCEKSEAGIDPTPGFIAGSVRFNKVLLFTDIDGSPSPIAMICLGTPVALFADNQGQSNSLAISFQLGFNPNDTAVESVSFDNLYWTKVGEYPDHEGDMRLFSRNKLVIGELGENYHSINGPAWITIKDTDSIDKKVISYTWSQSGNNLESTSIGGTNINSIYVSVPEDISPVSQTGLCSLNLMVTNATDTLNIYTNGSLNATNFNVDESRTTIYSDNYDFYSFFSVVASGAGSDKKNMDSSVVVGYGITSNVDSDALLTNSTRRLRNSLIVGSRNNISFPILQTSGSEILPDTSMIVGSDNKIWGGYNRSGDVTPPVASRTFLLGNENTVFNIWKNTRNPEDDGSIVGDQAETYVLGTTNRVGGGERMAENDTVSVRNFILGSRNTVAQAYPIGSEYVRSNRYVAGSNNAILLGGSSCITPDCYIFGSNNRIVIGADSNHYGNNKYVFGSNMMIQDWEEYVFGHNLIGVHVEHSSDYGLRLMSLGIVPGYFVGYTIGGVIEHGPENSRWDVTLPSKSSVISKNSQTPSGTFSDHTYPRGTVCISDIPDEDGFYQLLYYWPPNAS